MSPEALPDEVNPKRIARVRRCFDATGRLQRWPTKRSEQLLALWGVWALIPSDTRFDESEISALLRSWHDYEDYALVRRELIELDLMRRTPDGRVYRRVDHAMPEEVAQLVGQFVDRPRD